MTQSIKQVKKFDAEVGKVLNLMINSIYTNKEIFLRELISNASDACDKLRYQVINDTNLLNKESDELEIQVEIDKEKNFLSITDNGIGMNEEDMINNLGTIANSGTQNFLEKFNNKKNSNLNLIGQFGVGFYSAFMVSEIIKVISLKVGEKNAYEWVSDGNGEYSIVKLNKQLKRGTKIILKIKDSESEFLETYRLKHIINTYSEHVGFPIKLLANGGKQEVVNKASAIWMRSASEISEKEYEEFYNYVSHIPGKPLMTLHNKAEGMLEYTNLLFIPDSQPFDLFHPDRETKVKLYIKRVFISEKGNELIPPYLRFLRGVVDSEDLPLNISRETLQQNKIIKKISNFIVKKVLGNLKIQAQKQPKKYELFWKNFSKVLKEGLCESTIEEKKMLLEICRFNSTSLENDFISLDRYIDKMVKGQNTIYFLNGDNLEALKNNPQLEGFKKRGVEVLLLSDHVDNFWVNVVHKYKDKNFQSITSEKINLNKIKNLENEQKEEGNSNKNSEQYSALRNFVKKILADRVRDVVISSKLVNSPACISTIEGGMNPRMENFLIKQNQLNSKSPQIFEINPTHEILKKINHSLAKNNDEYDLNKNLIEVVYGQACLIEGDTIENPSNFACKLNALLERVV